jgi:DHA2 family methylenomycin A resistance protein-like MFS transporter
MFPEPAPSRRQALIGLLAICCAVFMTVMDTLIVNVALASMRQALGADLAHLQWVVDAYTLSFASCLLAAGALGDRLGYRRMFACGLWLFTLASAACGLAPNLACLVAARACQGVGASLLLPNALSLLNRTYADPAAKAKAVGIWACCSSAGGSAGPVVGGILTSAFGWRSIFFVNLPIGLLAFTLLMAAVPERRAEGRPRPFDAASQALAVLVLASLTYALIEGRARGWHAAVLPMAVLACSGAAFLARQRRSANPMLPPELPRIPAWRNGNLAAFIICFVYYGFVFMASLYFQSYRRFSPMVAGLTFLPMTLLQPFLHPFLGRWVARIGPRLPLALTLGLASLGVLLASFMGPGTSQVWLALIMLPFGLGASLGLSPALTSMLRAVPPTHSGVASGLFNTARQVGSLLGVAILGSFIGSETRFSLPGFHAAALLCGALMALGLLATLAWAQRDDRELPPAAMDLEPDWAGEG